MTSMMFSVTKSDMSEKLSSAIMSDKKFSVSIKSSNASCTSGLATMNKSYEDI